MTAQMTDPIYKVNVERIREANMQSMLRTES